MLSSPTAVIGKAGSNPWTKIAVKRVVAEMERQLADMECLRRSCYEHGLITFEKRRDLATESRVGKHNEELFMCLISSGATSFEPFLKMLKGHKQATYRQFHEKLLHASHAN